jgi:hypothetical protein
MSTSVWPAFPVTNLSGAKWPYHFSSLWAVPALYFGEPDTPIVYRRPDSQGPLERRFFEIVVRDLTTTPPRILIVDVSSTMQAMRRRRFDFIEYLSADPAFAALFRQYRRIRRVALWDVYEWRGPS